MLCPALPGSPGPQGGGGPDHSTDLTFPKFPVFPVRPVGAVYQWRKVPPSELSVELVADERLGWATDRAEASLRPCPRGQKRTAWGRCGSLLLHRVGLAPTTPCRSPGALIT